MARRLALVAFLFSLLATADPARATEDYFTEPCAKAGIPRELVVAIARQESSLHPWALNIRGLDYMPQTYKDAVHLVRRAQGAGVSYDVGIMQINNAWIEKWGIDPIELLDPTTNVQRGVAILAAEIERHGFNWKAVGRYHSPTDWRAQDYAWRVYKRLKGGNANGAPQIVRRRAEAFSNSSALEFQGLLRAKGIERKGRIIAFRNFPQGGEGNNDPQSGGSQGAPANDADAIRN